MATSDTDREVQIAKAMFENARGLLDISYGSWVDSRDRFYAHFQTAAPGREAWEEFATDSVNLAEAYDIYRVAQGKAEEAEMDALAARELARGDLAGAPDTLPCFECGYFDGKTAPERRVVKLGPVVNPADPTQTYVLECGHRAI